MEEGDAAASAELAQAVGVPTGLTHLEHSNLETALRRRLTPPCDVDLLNFDLGDTGTAGGAGFSKLSRLAHLIRLALQHFTPPTRAASEVIVDTLLGLPPWESAGLQHLSMLGFIGAAGRKMFPGRIGGGRLPVLRKKKWTGNCDYAKFAGSQISMLQIMIGLLEAADIITCRTLQIFRILRELSEFGLN